MTEPRLFHLQRTTDITGVSGTGRVADGVLWPDQTVSIRWRGDRPSTVFWDCLEDAEQVHGHGGHTAIAWDDDDATPDRDQAGEGATPPDASPYDADPAAVEWARARILYVIGMAEGASQNTTLTPETREQWRGIAGFMRRQLLGEGKAIPGYFDQRLPEWIARTHGDQPGSSR